MKDLLHISIAIGCVASFVITLCKKWGLVEWLQVHGSALVSEMAHCDFCLSWWVCVVLTILCIYVTGDLGLLLAPAVGTMVSRFLL